MSTDKPEIHYCEYHNCEEEATHYNNQHDVWLCDEHADGSPYANSGYCGAGCFTGYGCDQSC